MLFIHTMKWYSLIFILREISTVDCLSHFLNVIQDTASDNLLYRHTCAFSLFVSPMVYSSGSSLLPRSFLA